MYYLVFYFYAAAQIWETQATLSSQLGFKKIWYDPFLPLNIGPAGLQRVSVDWGLTNKFCPVTQALSSTFFFFFLLFLINKDAHKNCGKWWVKYPQATSVEPFCCCSVHTHTQTHTYIQDGWMFTIYPE